MTALGALSVAELVQLVRTLVGRGMPEQVVGRVTGLGAEIVRRMLANQHDTQSAVQ